MAVSRNVSAVAGNDNASAARRTLLWATLLAGTLDIGAAILSWLPRGVSPLQVLQGVASGVLGREARDGGVWSGLLGLALHFAIMSVIVAVFYQASTRLTVLSRYWIWCGLAYGIAVYVVMTFIVVPLSAAPFGTPPLPQILQGVLVHMTCVGLPIAFVTAAVRKRG